MRGNVVCSDIRIIPIQQAGEKNVGGKKVRRQESLMVCTEEKK